MATVRLRPQIELPTLNTRIQRRQLRQESLQNMPSALSRLRRCVVCVWVTAGPSSCSVRNIRRNRVRSHVVLVAHDFVGVRESDLNRLRQEQQV